MVIRSSLRKKTEEYLTELNIGTTNIELHPK